MKESDTVVQPSKTNQTTCDITPNNKLQQNDDDDDDDDVVLDEILEAKRQGYGEYQDDYDDINSGEDSKCDDVDVDDASDNDDDDSDDEEEPFFFGKRKVPESHPKTDNLTKKSKS